MKRGSSSNILRDIFSSVDGFQKTRKRLRRMTNDTKTEKLIFLKKNFLTPHLIRRAVPRTKRTSSARITTEKKRGSGPFSQRDG